MLANQPLTNPAASAEILLKTHLLLGLFNPQFNTLLFGSIVTGTTLQTYPDRC
jgi:hypothetical protein